MLTYIQNNNVYYKYEFSERFILWSGTCSIKTIYYSILQINEHYKSETIDKKSLCPLYPLH